MLAYFMVALRTGIFSHFAQFCFGVAEYSWEEEKRKQESQQLQQ